jgi:hypothetical protein
MFPLKSLNRGIQFFSVSLKSRVLPFKNDFYSIGVEIIFMANQTFLSATSDESEEENRNNDSIHNVVIQQTISSQAATSNQQTISSQAASSNQQTIHPAVGPTFNQAAQQSFCQEEQHPFHQAANQSLNEAAHHSFNQAIR